MAQLGAACRVLILTTTTYDARHLVASVQLADGIGDHTRGLAGGVLHRARGLIEGALVGQGFVAQEIAGCVFYAVLGRSRFKRLVQHKIRGNGQGGPAQNPEKLTHDLISPSAWDAFVPKGVG